MKRTTAAIIAASLLTAVALFQTALALGAPFGDAVLGGRAPTDQGVLPTGYRIAAALQALLLLGMAAVLLARAGVVPSRRRAGRFLVVAAWAVAGFMALSTLGNLSSDHPFERWVLGSVTVVVAALATVVAHRSSAAYVLDEERR
jgi:hypothetical protein